MDSKEDIVPLPELYPDEDDATVNKKIEEMFPPKVREKWDAETIISTYTSTENHSMVVREPAK